MLFIKAADQKGEPADKVVAKDNISVVEWKMYEDIEA